MENLYYSPMSPQREELRKEWNGSGLDWEQYVKDAELAYQIEQSKKFLKDNGYFVDNLWTVHDVTHRYECSNEKAQEILNEALTNSATVEQIQFAINMSAEFADLPKQKGKHFLISGYYKEDKNPFEDYIVQEKPNESELDASVEEDTRIFFYDLTEEDLKKHIELGEKTWLDFVITSYEETTLN